MTAEERSVLEFNLDACHFGARAIEHAMRTPKCTIRIELNAFLELAHSLDVEKIVEAIQDIGRLQELRRRQGHKYSLKSCLLSATKDLLKLRLCQSHITYGEINGILISCWNGAGASRTGQRQQEDEQQYQRKVLIPQMQMLFQYLCV